MLLRRGVISRNFCYKWIIQSIYQWIYCAFSPIIDESTQKLSLNEEPTLTSKSFALPKNYDALSLLNDTEQVHTFAHKSNSKIDRQQKLAPNTTEKSSHFCSSSSSLSKKLATRRKIRDMQVLGCLIMELFLPKKYLTLGSSHANLISRYKLAIHILKNEPNSLPHCIRATVQSLLLPPKDHLHESFGINDSGMLWFTISQKRHFSVK